MNYENLLYEVNDGVATITLNRPEVYNALSSQLLKEITHAIHTTAEDAQVRAVVLTATGDKAFSSGADLKGGSMAADLGESLRQNYNPMIRAMRNLPKPIICRMNGLAAGAGCSLALACDVIIASETAYFSQIFVNIGLMPDAGSTFFLPRLIGHQRTFELMSTARRLFAPEAQATGMILKAVSPNKLDETVAEVVNYYKNAPTLAIGQIKLALNQSFTSDLDQMLDFEATHQSTLGKTHDFMEGVMAFAQKRKPVFKGK